MRAQVRSWKSNFFPKIVAVRNGTENSVLSTKHFGCLREIAVLDSLPDGSAADHFPIYQDWRNSNDAEIKLRAKLFEQIEIPTPIFPKRPFMADTDFAQRS